MSAFLPWKIVDVELRRGFPDLPADPGAGGCRAVFWSDGVPLGHLDLPASRLPVGARELRDLALPDLAANLGSLLFETGFEATMPVPWHHRPVRVAPDLGALLELAAPLRELARAIDDPVAAQAAGRTSLIVCTRERPESLTRCLASLRELDPAPQEIVVVDNAPAGDATRRIVDGSTGVRYVAEPRPGLSAARNTGLRAARGEYVAFTDDDVTVHPAWLGRLHRGFRDDTVLGVTGLMLPAELRTAAQLAFEWGGETWGYRPREFGPDFFDKMRGRGAPVWSIGAGANMIFRRRVFDELGGFDERLGAGASGCSEDSELWYRILATGRRCRYEPGAVVFHHHRADAAGLRSQMYQYMRGHVVALLLQCERYGHRGNLYRLLVQLPLYYARKIAGRVVARGAMPRLPLRPQMLGGVAGLGYYLRHRRQPPFPDGPVARDGGGR